MAALCTYCLRERPAGQSGSPCLFCGRGPEIQQEAFGIFQPGTVLKGSKGASYRVGHVLEDDSDASVETHCAVNLATGQRLRLKAFRSLHLQYALKAPSLKRDRKKRLLKWAEEKQESFLSLAQISSLVQPPSLAPVLDSFRAASTVIAVAEEGEDLSFQQAVENGLLPEGQALIALFLPVLRELGAFEKEAGGTHGNVNRFTLRWAPEGLRLRDPICHLVLSKMGIRWNREFIVPLSPL